MTLREWENAFKPLPATLPHSFWRHSIPENALWYMYHLDDFAVSFNTAVEVRFIQRLTIHYPEDWQ